MSRSSSGKRERPRSLNDGGRGKKVRQGEHRPVHGIINPRHTTKAKTIAKSLVEVTSLGSVRAIVDVILEFLLWPRSCSAMMAHADRIGGFAFDTLAKELYTSSWDGSIKIWRWGDQMIGRTRDLIWIATEGISRRVHIHDIFLHRVAQTQSDDGIHHLLSASVVSPGLFCGRITLALSRNSGIIFDMQRPSSLSGESMWGQMAVLPSTKAEGLKYDLRYSILKCLKGSAASAVEVKSEILKLQLQLTRRSGPSWLESDGDEDGDVDDGGGGKEPREEARRFNGVEFGTGLGQSVQGKAAVSDSAIHRDGVVCCTATDAEGLRLAFLTKRRPEKEDLFKGSSATLETVSNVAGEWCTTGYSSLLRLEGEILPMVKLGPRSNLVAVVTTCEKQCARVTVFAEGPSRSHNQMSQSTEFKYENKGNGRRRSMPILRFTPGESHLAIILESTTIALMDIRSGDIASKIAISPLGGLQAERTLLSIPIEQLFLHQDWGNKDRWNSYLRENLTGASSENMKITDAQFVPWEFARLLVATYEGNGPSGLGLIFAVDLL